MNDLYKKIKPYLFYIIALAAGAIMPYGFAPYYEYGGIASIASLTLLMGCLAKRSRKQALLVGWLYGIGMFGLGVSWVYISIHDFGAAAPWLATLITGLFVATLSLFPAGFAYCLNRFFPGNNYARLLLAFPALWVVFEMLRGWLFTGFPWLYVGYSHLGNHLSAFAAVGSVWLVSWAAALVAAFLYGILEFYYFHRDNLKARNGLIIGMGVIWGIAFGCHKIQWVTPTTPSMDVALVQGNIPQLMRWDPQHVAQIIETYQLLTKEALNNELIIWPEGAIPVPLPLSNSLFTELDGIMKAHNSALIAGVPSELPNHQYYNSLVAVGNASGIYHKSHLVPFGEYVPFESILRGLISFFDLPMSSFVSGSMQQAPLTAQGFRFAPAICYEIAYPVFVRDMSYRADYILTGSNDTWFGKSIGPAQHLQIAQFRALEMGKYVLRATNTGFTAFIAPDGQIQAIANQFEATVLTSTITPMMGKTPWARFGIWPLFGALLIAMGLAFLIDRKKIKFKKK